MTSKIRQKQKASRVAVLVDSSTSWGRQIIEGVHRYQSTHAHWQLFVEARGVEQRRWLPTGWEGDGVIARIGFPELSTQLKELDLPVVNVSAIELPDTPFPRITTHLKESADMAADHFLDSGFRHFAYLSLEGLDYVAVHKEAFRKRVGKFGFTCQIYEATPQLGAAEPDWKMNINHLAEWLTSLPKPVAILTWSTSGAREIIYACDHAGLMVPEEVSVVSGSDDELFCKVAPVPISAVKLAGEEIGFRAAKCLDMLMARRTVRQVKDQLVSPLGISVRRSSQTLAVDDPALVKAIRYIREDPARVMGVDDIAAHAGLGRRVLEQRFSKVLGRTPATEIRRARIGLAIHLLQTTHVSIAAVAERAGFNTAEYMATVFRNQIGMSPVSFRRRET